ITGATAGFGRAMTEKFLKNGDLVIATGRRTERLEELKKSLGDNLYTAKLDVKNMNEVQDVLKNLPEKFRKIDLLVNNAGLAVGMGSAQKSNIEDWSTMVDTNITGVLNCTQAILPGMVERNKGHIINLGSVAGEFPYPGGNVYGATKAFVHQFSLNLKADLLGTAVRVTNVEPGMCETEFSEVRFGGDKDKAASVYKGMKPLSADDVAETIFWVASRPAHVNINVISLMPVQQSFGPFATDRKN
ncbi:MAG: SDR family oxidoreductase, partial [Bdellovibrionales bacterium]|nr:SDR family oxidoreductase [Bdellovibrionales bacterium]